MHKYLVIIFIGIILVSCTTHLSYIEHKKIFLSMIDSIENKPIDTNYNYIAYNRLLMDAYINKLGFCLIDNDLSPWINAGNSKDSTKIRWQGALLASFMAGSLIESNNDPSWVNTVNVGNQYVLRTYNKIRIIDTCYVIPFLDSLNDLKYRKKFEENCRDSLNTILYKKK